MEIRDVIHGSINIHRDELPVIDSRYFQRLRQIKQLGFGEFSFPSATHNRYIHSLGAMETAQRAFQSIFGHALRHNLLPDDRMRGFRSALRFAALLHDVGHGPLSHTTETAMPAVKHLGLADSNSPRQATHEDYTLKIILDSSLTPLLKKAGAAFGFTPLHIACLIDSKLTPPDDFFKEKLDGETTNFRPILQQLISSELDVDRMDYLRRDSLAAGVSYGQFDYDWLLNNLTYHVYEGKCLLALQHRALYSFEDFLISRFHMFLMVYFHHRAVIYDEMLKCYFNSQDCDYTLPADIEKYAECNDFHLYSHLAQSKNEWARRITEKRPYRMLLELHSGIPTSKTAALEQEKLLKEVVAELEGKNIDRVIAQSTGELSKYFRKPGELASLSRREPQIFVRYDNLYSSPGFIPLEQCTDLFKKYGEKRSITRLYVAPEKYDECHKSSRQHPFKYLDADEK